VISRFFRSLSSQERNAFWAILVLHLVLISFPYLWALTTTPNGFVYGGLLYNPDDQNVHLAWARQAAEGQFFFRDLFTNESLLSGERPLFTNLLCWLIGVLSALTTIPTIWLYHAFRIIFAALTLLLFFALTTRLTADRRVRITATALAAFAGGAGFLSALIPGFNWMDRPDNASFPMMPEAFTFASSLIFTLNIASMALLLAVYLLSLHAWETGSRKAAIGAGVATLFLANFHTYDVFPLLGALFIWAIFAWRTPAQRGRLIFLPAVIVGAAIPVLYQLFVFRGSEEFRIKALTNTPAPPIWDVAISYGPLLLLAIGGAIIAWREVKLRLPIFWMLVTLGLIYAPVSFARKMIEGLHLPLCFLAAVGLIWLVGKLQPTAQRMVTVIAVLILSLSSFQFVTWCIDNARDNNASRANILMPPLYLTQGDAAAMQFLKQQPRGKVVLCLPFIGNYMPRESGQTVMIGHWAETLHFPDKLGQVLGFYGGKMEAEQAKEWLNKNRIGYVVIGSYENQLGARLPLELQEIFEANGTRVYAVP